MTTPWALAALTNAAGVWRGLYSHRLSHPVLRIALHTAPFRGSAIVPTILSFLSRALKRRVPSYTRASLRLDCSRYIPPRADTEATPFTEVPGMYILRSPDAGSCIAPVRDL